MALVPFVEGAATVFSDIEAGTLVATSASEEPSLMEVVNNTSKAVNNVASASRSVKKSFKRGYEVLKGGKVKHSKKKPSKSAAGAGTSDKFDGHHSSLMTIGGSNPLVSENFEPGVYMTLGKQIRDAYPTSVRNMLAHMQGSGKVTATWAGVLDCAIDKRERFYTHFRHCLNANDSVPVAYPSTALVMKPLGSSFTVGTNSINEHPFTLHTSGKEYFAPLNRPCYEDMSWNLNRFKLKPQSQAETLAIANNAADPTYQMIHTPQDAHTHIGIDSQLFRGHSSIRRNNQELVSGTAGSETTFATSKKGVPYKYNMVFTSGQAKYAFMNKGTGPVKVTVLIYKLKKTGIAAIEDSKPSADNATMQRLLEEPVRKGYLSKRMNKFGTVSMNGRVPQLADCVTNPAHPFLPSCRETLQTDLPFKEDRRVSFVMESGARRQCTIELGGNIYDPSEVPTRSHSVSTTSWPSRKDSYIDQHSYTVCICVEGIQTTRQLGTDLGTSSSANHTLVGDCYSPGSVQYYCEYTERIASAQYQLPRSERIFVNGLMKDIVVPEGVDTEAVTLVPQGSEVRESAVLHNHKKGP
jgi:hypothetical protein